MGKERVEAGEGAGPESTPLRSKSAEKPLTVPLTAAHNQKDVGSNPTTQPIKCPEIARFQGIFLCFCWEIIWVKKWVSTLAHVLAHTGIVLRHSPFAQIRPPDLIQNAKFILNLQNILK